MQVWSLGWEDSLEKGMATHSSNFVWRIPWTQGLDGLQPMGSQSWTQLKRLSTTQHVPRLIFHQALVHPLPKIYDMCMHLSSSPMPASWLRPPSSLTNLVWFASQLIFWLLLLLLYNPYSRQKLDYFLKMCSVLLDASNNTALRTKSKCFQIYQDLHDLSLILLSTYFLTLLDYSLQFPAPSKKWPVPGP